MSVKDTIIKKHFIQVPDMSRSQVCGTIDALNLYGETIAVQVTIPEYQLVGRENDCIVYKTGRRHCILRYQIQ